MNQKLPKIALYGPESTGKSTLAAQLAEHFGTIAAPEFARDYLMKNGNRFDPRLDRRPIAEGQRDLEKSLAAEAERLGGPCLFCDTDVLTVFNYSLFCFDEAPVWLEKMARRERCDFYLFLEIDVAWQADELRTHGHERERQRAIWASSLERFGCRFIKIEGIGAARFEAARAAVAAFL